jgi:hypothetical protein
LEVIMSIFGGQFGSFGGGFVGGAPGGQSGQQGMQFGGGFMMNPTAQATVVQEVAVAEQGALTFYATPSSLRPRDRSGRKTGGWAQGPAGGTHRQKRY